MDLAEWYNQTVIVKPQEKTTKTVLMICHHNKRDQIIGDTLYRTVTYGSVLCGWRADLIIVFDPPRNAREREWLAVDVRTRLAKDAVLLIGGDVLTA